MVTRCITVASCMASMHIYTCMYTMFTKHTHTHTHTHKEKPTAAMQNTAIATQ